MRIFGQVADMYTLIYKYRFLHNSLFFGYIAFTNICYNSLTQILANIHQTSSTKRGNMGQKTVVVPQGIHISYMPKYSYDLLKWSHVIKSHSVSNCTIWSHLAICFHLSINPGNIIEGNLNWQSPQDIHHVDHKYSSEFIIPSWAQNPCFDLLSCPMNT